MSDGETIETEHSLYNAGQIEMLMVAQRVRPQASPMPVRTT